MIHYKKVESWAKIKNDEDLRIYSGKEEIIGGVAKIPGLEKLSIDLIIKSLNEGKYMLFKDPSKP